MMQRRVFLRLSSCIVVMLGVLLGWGVQRAPAQKQPIPVGIIGDLSGPTSALAEMAYSVRDYFNYINSKGGVRGHEIDHLLVDGAEVIPVEVSNYKRLITRHKPVAIYIWSTGGNKALRKACSYEDKLVCIAESISEELVDARQWPYHFVFGPTYEDQIRLGLQWMKEQGATRVAVGRCNLDWCVSPTDRVLAEKYAEKLGLQVVGVVTWPARPTDLTSEVLRLKGMKPDFVWVMDSVEGAIPLTRAAGDVGFDSGKFVAIHWPMHPAVPKAGGKAAEGFKSFEMFPDVGTAIDKGLAVGKEIQEYLKAHPGRARRAARTWHYVRGWVKAKVLSEAIGRALDQAGGVPRDLSVFRKLVRDALEGLKGYDVGAGLPPINYADHRGFIAARMMIIKGGRWQPLTGEWIEIGGK